MTNINAQASDFDARLEEAVELREDGDYEESIDKFKSLFDQFPKNPRIAWEYANALMKLNRPHDADEILGQAANGNPADFHINKAWTLHAAFMADSMKDHMNAIRRGRAFREAFPPKNYPEAWQSLAIEIDMLYEIGFFDNLEFVIDEYWEDLISQPEILPIGLHFLSKLFLNKKVLKMIDQAKPEAWSKLPPESRVNLRLRAILASQVERLVKATDTRVISLGQNCFPYQVGGQWGLKGSRAHLSDLTFLDRAMFYNDAVAQTIETNFSDFSDPINFEFSRGFGRCRMPRHKPTGATFYHDRATFFEFEEDSHFLDNITRRIDNWNSLINSGERRLFIYSLCGSCDLDKLIAVADKFLLDEVSHLVIVDVLQQSHTCVSHPRITYIHAPYPSDFDWIKINSYSSNAGFRWEMTFMTKVVDLLLRPLDTDAVEKFHLEQQLTFQQTIENACKNSDYLILDALLSTYLLRFDADSKTIIKSTDSLRLHGKTMAADKILSQSIKTGPATAHLYRSWTESATYSAHWHEAIDRAEQFCAAFPPDSEPLAWAGVRYSLIAHYESGLWQPAHNYILRYWKGFTQQPELFSTALDFLDKHSYFDTARNLIIQAAPEAQLAFPPEILSNISSRMTDAAALGKEMRGANVKIIPIGQNTMPSLILGRWGLRDERQDFNQITPFDYCDFFGIAASEAINSNFDAFRDHSHFKTVPVMVGGEIIEHVPSGATFFLARRAVWDDSALQAFHDHLNIAISNWQALHEQERRIYVHVISRPTDIDQLIAAAQQHLLKPESYLVVIDMQEHPAIISTPDQVVYLHAPTPDDYDYNHLVKYSSSAGMTYEYTLLEPVISIMRNYSRG